MVDFHNNGSRRAGELNTDTLTGLSNRLGVTLNLFSNYSRSMEELLFEYSSNPTLNEKWFNNKRVDFGKMSLVMLDIDFFKRVNDGYCHTSGDILLHDFGRSMISFKKNYLKRDGDQVATGRLGGEEFIIIAVDTSKENLNHLVNQYFRPSTPTNEPLNKNCLNVCTNKCEKLLDIVNTPVNRTSFSAGIYEIRVKNRVKEIINLANNTSETDADQDIIKRNMSNILLYADNTYDFLENINDQEQEILGKKIKHAINSQTFKLIVYQDISKAMQAIDNGTKLAKSSGREQTIIYDDNQIILEVGLQLNNISNSIDLLRNKYVKWIKNNPIFHESNNWTYYENIGLETLAIEEFSKRFIFNTTGYDELNSISKNMIRKFLISTSVNEISRSNDECRLALLKTSMPELYAEVKGENCTRIQYILSKINYKDKSETQNQKIREISNIIGNFYNFDNPDPLKTQRELYRIFSDNLINSTIFFESLKDKLLDSNENYKYDINQPFIKENTDFKYIPTGTYETDDKYVFIKMDGKEPYSVPKSNFEKTPEGYFTFSNLYFKNDKNTLFQKTLN